MASVAQRERRRVRDRARRPRPRALRVRSWWIEEAAAIPEDVFRSFHPQVPILWPNEDGVKFVTGKEESR